MPPYLLDVPSARLANPFAKLVRGPEWALMGTNAESPDAEPGEVLVLP